MKGCIARDHMKRQNGRIWMLGAASVIVALAFCATAVSAVRAVDARSQPRAGARGRHAAAPVATPATLHPTAAKASPPAPAPQVIVKVGRQERDAFDYALLVTTGLAALVSVGALIAAVLSANAARRSATDARQTYELGQRQYRASIRPHVTASLERFEKNGACGGIVLRNTGKGAAYGVTAQLTWTATVHPPSVLPQDETRSEEYRARDLAAGDFEPVEYAAEQFATYDDFWGTIRYQDIDGTVYQAQRAEGQSDWTITEIGGIPNTQAA